MESTSRPSGRTSPVNYKLYRDETACDSDDWGPPEGEYPSLFDAMRATGVPLGCWQTGPYCPDEVFTETTPQWSILAPGAAAEAQAMRVSPPRPLTMADLTPGTRVRHAGWGDTGTIRQCGEVTEFRPDEHFGDIGVSPEGPVFPADLEILRPAVKPLCDMTGQEFADYMGELDEALSACDAGVVREDIIRRGEAAVAETDRRRGQQ